MASPALDPTAHIHGAKPDKLPVAPLQGTQLRLATIGLSLATFMQVLDTTIANVSVPNIAGGLGLSAGQGVWVITSFSAASAISMPLTGRLAERFGQVRVFMTATVLFIIASFLCGISPSMQALVAARVLQGAVAGPLVPLSQALLLAIHPPQKRGYALSVWGTIAITAPIVGPILGGYISDNASWPWIFLINVPVGIVAIGLVWTTLHRLETPRARPPLDTCCTARSSARPCCCLSCCRPSSATRQPGRGSCWHPSASYPYSRRAPSVVTCIVWIRACW
jgi:DHA2 family multidrug resistance protein